MKPLPLDETYDPFDRPSPVFEAKPITKPEECLMLAVLERAAIEVAYRGVISYGQKQSTTIRAQALEWFDSPEQEWLYSCENICSTLGFSASRVRKLAHENPALLVKGLTSVPAIR